VNKFDEFKALIASLSMPHIILITETWFNTKSLVLLDGYNLFVKNRQAISHGGVVIYVREDILAMEELELQDEGEMVWCKIILPTEFLLVGCIYRPPHSHWEPNQAILKAITKACALANRRKNTGLIIAGDFNHPDIIWTNNRGAFGGKKGRNSSISMVDCLLELELNQLVKNPTFGSNVLDLVITNEESRIYQISHGPPISTSKKNRLHCTLTWEYELKSGTQKWTGRTRRNFTKGNYNKFSDIMSELSLGPDGDPNEAVSNLIEKYQEAVEICVPIIKPNRLRKFKPKWFNSEIKQRVTKKFSVFCQIRAGAKGEEIKANYRKICKETKLAVRSARLKFEENLVSKCKSEPKMLYNYINSQKSGKDSIRMLKGADGKLTTDMDTIVNILND